MRSTCCARRRRREQACRRERRTAPREGAAPRADERLVRWVDEHARVPGERLWPRRRDDAARHAAHSPPQRHAPPKIQYDPARDRRHASCWRSDLWGAAAVDGAYCGIPRLPKHKLDSTTKALDGQREGAAVATPPSRWGQQCASVDYRSLDYSLEGQREGGRLPLRHP